MNSTSVTPMITKTPAARAPAKGPRVLGLLLMREFMIERRTLGWTGSMGLLAMITVFALALGFHPEPSGQVKSALSVAGLWLVFIFAGSVGMNRAFAQERESRAFDALLQLPCDPVYLYLSKVIAGLVYLLVALLAMLAAAHVFLDLPLVSLISLLAPVLLLAALGYVACGTLVAAMTSSMRGRDALLAIALFPIVMPLFVAATSASRDAMLGGTLVDVKDELMMLAAFDAIYLSLGMLSFGKVVEAS